MSIRDSYGPVHVQLLNNTLATQQQLKKESTDFKITVSLSLYIYIAKPTELEGEDVSGGGGGWGSHTILGTSVPMMHSI